MNETDIKQKNIMKNIDWLGGFWFLNLDGGEARNQRDIEILWLQTKHKYLTDEKGSPPNT